MRVSWKTLLFLSGVAGYVGYRARRKLVARVLNLPAPQYEVRRVDDVHVLMADGTALVHDYFAPLDAPDAPTILIRSPYGRNINGSIFGALLAFFAERYAERGYHVVLQDVRGRFDSAGEFRPYLDEQDDALATVVWLREQPWFNGNLGLWGASYLGIVQWLLVNQVPEVKAIMPIFAATGLREILYHDGALAYGLVMRWLSIFDVLDNFKDNPLLNAPRYIAAVEHRSSRAYRNQVVSTGDEVATGAQVAFYQEWLDNEAEDSDLWEQGLSMLDVEVTDVPVHLIGGWYDLFLREQLHDYDTLRANGQMPYLTIGAWAHFDMVNGMIPGVREGLRWFDAHLKGEAGKLRGLPVRLYLMGANEWREYMEFPPPAQMTPFYLHPGQKLAPETPQTSETLHYTYNPEDPTPAPGGAIFAFDLPVKDNRIIEERPDVLSFTSDALQQDMDVIGYVQLQLYVNSSLEHTDFFGRLCEVQPDGSSLNICDGLFRIKPGTVEPQPDGSLCIEIGLWATAYRFKRGNRIRLLVSSGAHPRWLANPGTGATLRETGKDYQIADQQVHIGEAHPSVLLLPVVT